MRTASIAAAALLVGVISSAHAATHDTAWLEKLLSAPDDPDQNAIAATYVTGVADTLSTDGKVCPPPYANAQSLLDALRDTFARPDEKNIPRDLKAPAVIGVVAGVLWPCPKSRTAGVSQ